MSFETLRYFADTWGLLYLVVTFAGLMAFAFRPGSKEYYDAAARNALDRE